MHSDAYKCCPGKPGKFLYPDDKFYYPGEGALSGKILYLTVGPNLRKLMEPGKVCSSTKSCCGWIVVRRRRRQYYAYLQQPEGGDCYLGPINRFPLVPIILTLKFDTKQVIVDTSVQPATAEEIISMVKSLSIIIELFSDELRKILSEVTTKYKVR